ncbi:MAG: type IV secretion system DNA-binding domain-containing protein [Phocaeicola vulgatus]|nr:type IV secretion system DNA-binding domain-containing protein [Phocaeicola vulgatus]
MNMDHMFIMRLAALLFGGGIASCLFPGKSRMSHVLFLLLILAETAVAHATIPDGWWFLLPGVVSVLLRLSFKGGFLVYGGAGSGKTKSIGKPLMEQYIRSGFAGFIYDFKDFDYTRTAYNLIRKHGYPHEFYYVNFTDMNRTYRFNPLDRRNIKDRTMLMQLMEDVLGALMPPTSKQDEWYTGALGILNGVAYRLWDEFPECCTLPHIVNFVMKADTGQLQEFLKLNDISAMMAGAYLKAEGSEKTQASYVSTLSNYVAKLATNENICYVLTGNDFDFNLIDPEHPKLFAISNNYATESVISPVIAMVMSIASRSFSMENRVPFVFILDEMTTFKVRDFEKLPSVLREYGAAFLLLTQSGAKLEKLYSKLDRSSIEANFGNIFLGRTQDVEALKYYPLFFGKYEKDRNSSVTISTQKEEIYESKDFASLEPGEFIGMGNRSNIKGHFRKKFRLFELEEEPLPVVAFRTEKEISDNYTRILKDIERVLGMEEIDVNSLFTDR